MAGHPEGGNARRVTRLRSNDPKRPFVPFRAGTSTRRSRWTDIAGRSRRRDTTRSIRACDPDSLIRDDHRTVGRSFGPFVSTNSTVGAFLIYEGSRRVGT